MYELSTARQEVAHWIDRSPHAAASLAQKAKGPEPVQMVTMSSPEGASDGQASR